MPPALKKPASLPRTPITDRDTHERAPDHDGRHHRRCERRARERTLPASPPSRACRPLPSHTPAHLPHPPSNRHNLQLHKPACRPRSQSGGATQMRATRRCGQTHSRSCTRENRPGRMPGAGRRRGGRPRFGGRRCRRRCPKGKGRGGALTPSTRHQPKPTKIGCLKAGDGVPVDAHAVRAELETYAWCGKDVGSRAHQPHLLSLSLPPLPLLHRTVHTTTTPPPLTT